MKNHLMIAIALTIGTYSASGQSMNDLLYEGAQNSASLKAKYYQYTAALERIDQQNSLPDPTLSFGYFISPIETRVGPQNFKLSISQMFPWMGTLKSQEAVAAAEAKVHFENFQEAKNQLFYDLKLAYLDLYLLEKEIALHEKDLQVLKSYEPITKIKYEANLVPLSDLVRAQIAIEHAQSEIEVMKAKRIPLTSRLNELLNRKQDQKILLFELPSIVDEKEASLDSALTNHPSLLKAQSQVSYADEQLDLSRQKRKPSIGVGLDYVFVGERTDMDLANNGNDAFMPMVSLSLPIFGKRNKAVVKETQLLRSSAIEQLSATQNAIRSAWSEKVYLDEKARIEIEQLTREIDQTTLLLNVLLTQYSNDNINFEEVLATQQKLLQLRIAVLAAQNGLYRAQFLASYLTGSSLKEIINHENE